MHAQFLGKDPDSQVENSPTLFATDRTDRGTYIAQGWKVTDPQALADIGPVPEHEAPHRDPRRRAEDLRPRGTSEQEEH